MGIDGIGQDSPAFVAIAIPQPSLTRKEQELHLEEGQPPLEVVSAEQQAVSPQPPESLQPRRARRRGRRGDDELTDDDPGNDEAAPAETISPSEQDGRSTEEEATGTLFDDRS
jgi:hypothetical protein